METHMKNEKFFTADNRNQTVPVSFRFPLLNGNPLCLSLLIWMYIRN